MDQTEDRRDFDQVEQDLIRRGKRSEAKVRWTKRYHAGQTKYGKVNP